MAATLGTYSIDLVAKIAQFESDLGRAARIAEQQGQSIRDSIGRAVEGVTDKLKEMAAVVGVGFSLEGLKGLIDKLAETSSEALKTAETIENLGQVLGISAETIQTVSLAASLVGGNLDTAATALTRLSRSAAEANAGNAKLLADFNAIGISAEQLSVLLQRPDDLIRVVTQHLSEFSNQGDKVAIVTQLMGRNAAQSIPMIQELGQHYATLQEQAQKFAGVSDDMIKAMADQQKEFNRTGVEVKGLALQFTAELLPAIKASQEAMKSGIESQATHAAIKNFADTLDYVAQHFKEFASDVANYGVGYAISKAFVQGTEAGLTFSNEMKTLWYEIQREATIAWAYVVKASEDAGVAMQHALVPALTAMSNAALLLQGNVGLAKGLADLAEKFKDAKSPADNLAASINKANLTFWTQASALQAVTGQLDTMVVHAKEGGDKVAHLPKQVKDATDESGAALLKFSEQIDKLASNVEGPYGKAMDQFAEGMKRLELEAQQAAIQGADVTQVIKLWQEGEALLTEKVVEQTDATTVLNTAMQAIDATVAHHLDLIGKTGTELAVEAEYQKLLNEALKAMDAVMGPLTEDEQKRLTGLHSTAEALVALDEQQKQSISLLKDWSSQAASQFDSAFSTINKDILEGGNVMKDLVNIAKQVVEAIILQFEKLAIINPLLNQIFGQSTGTLLPTLQTAGGALSTLLGGGLSSSGVIPGGGTYNLVPVGGNSGLFGTGLSGLGLLSGLGAGIGEFGAAGGGLGGLAGGISYGVGAYALSGALTAGIAAAATGGISAGLAAGFASIPVVGWIGLAAMGLNILTGGGLFGTKAKPYGSEFNLGVGPGGTSLSAAIDEKGKKAFFGGSYYKTVSTPVDQATQDSVAQFFAGLQQAATQEAAAFGESTSTIVTGTFHETFDKAGKMLTQISTVAGQKFSESIQDFQTRVIADTLLANMGDASKEAEAIAAQWQKSAADLLAGAEFLSQAQLDIIHGNALVQGDTLTQLTAFVQGMSAQGESLIQTYTRLSVEVTDVQTILHGLGLDIGKTGEALVKFDDDMVKAAGSLDNLNKLWSDYYNNFYSDSERAAIKLQNDQAQARTLLQGIGQDPNETMAQFRQNFTAMLSSLSPADVVKWLQAGESLAALNADLQGTTDAAAAAAKAQQDHAQSLYDAAQKAAAGLQTLIQNTQQLAASLFGSQAQQLQAQLDQFKGTDLYQFEKVILQPQIDAANQQEAAAKSIGDASTLLNDFAQIGVVSGQSLKDLATQFHVPLDKLATMLGTDASGLQKQFSADEAIAAASLNIDNNTKLSAEYLADIKALLEGKAAPFSATDFVNAISGATPAVPGGKVGRSGIGGVPAPSDVVEAVNTSSQNSTDIIAALLRNIDASLRELGSRVGSVPPSDTRVYRTTFARQP